MFSGECSRYIGGHCGGGGSEVIKWLNYSSEFWAEVEDNELFGSIVPSSAKRGSVK
jgi:hypothetical protein